MHANIGSSTYPERLDTFRGYWDECEATARQLAAIGHVYDRPPLEALEEGSRCVSCGCFVKRNNSIIVLQSPITNNARGSCEDSSIFHHAGCIRRQVRIPIEKQDPFVGRISDIRRRFERNSADGGRNSESATRQRQKSSLFSLPTELRLEIYSLVLPVLSLTTEIVTLHRESSRLVSSTVATKTGPRDLTKTNVLRTCHEVHEEALDILFTRITYKFASTKLLYVFLRNIGHRGRQLLQSVDVQCGMREDAVAFALLASCPKLKAITIRLTRQRLLYPGSPIWCVDGMACLLELSGLERVTFDTPRADNVLSIWVNQQMLSLRHDTPDAVVVRQELLRPKGEGGRLEWHDGQPVL